MSQSLENVLERIIRPGDKIIRHQQQPQRTQIEDSFILASSNCLVDFWPLPAARAIGSKGGTTLEVADYRRGPLFQNCSVTRKKKAFIRRAEREKVCHKGPIETRKSTNRKDIGTMTGVNKYVAALIRERNR